MTQPQILEGTWDEIKQHDKELEGKIVRVFIVSTEETMEERATSSQPAGAKRPSALGKYAYVPGGSEAFAREKQQEIEREDRKCDPFVPLGLCPIRFIR